MSSFKIQIFTRFQTVKPLSVDHHPIWWHHRFWPDLKVARRLTDQMRISFCSIW
jgi:hypothetical protein